MPPCEPELGTHEVPFDPVRDTLIEIYGSATDNPSFVDAFKVVLVSGGCDSPTFKYLFTTPVCLSTKSFGNVGLKLTGYLLPIQMNSDIL